MCSHSELGECRKSIHIVRRQAVVESKDHGRHKQFCITKVRQSGREQTACLKRRQLLAKRVQTDAVFVSTLLVFGEYSVIHQDWSATQLTRCHVAPFLLVRNRNNPTRNAKFMASRK